MISFINDNNPNGPKRQIVRDCEVIKTLKDDEPYQQLIALECGHWLYNTYGDKYPQLTEGQFLNCRFCRNK